MLRYICLIWIFIISLPAFSQGNILILGDSLSAGYGISVDKSWPSLLQEKLTKNQFPHKVYNASISGQTSSEGLKQIDRLLSIIQPVMVVIELGANDGLRGLSTQEMQSNLQSIITKSQSANAQVLLIGIRVPSNYGRRYSAMFEDTFKTLAANNQIAFIPFMLAPIAKILTSENHEQYIQTDGLHPTEYAQPILLDHIYPTLIKSFKP